MVFTKGMIHRSRLLAAMPETERYRKAVEYKMELPEEPLIYSVKHRVGHRELPLMHFRNRKFMSMFKCHFQQYMNVNIPVVLIINFYVKPFDDVKLNAKQLKSEKIPATRAFELSEYLLSFKELLLHVLINSYRQVVHIEMSKWYSSNPRTEFQFMKWDNYAKYKAQDKNDAKTKAVDSSRAQESLVQPVSCGNEAATDASTEEAEGCKPVELPVASDKPLQNPRSIRKYAKKTPSATFIPTRKET